MERRSIIETIVSQGRKRPRGVELPTVVRYRPTIRRLMMFDDEFMHEHAPHIRVGTLFPT